MRRALWITRFDWVTEADLRRIVQLAIRAGFTDLLMQARGAGDALYRSRVAPASPKIAGRVGGDPTWDPLKLVIDGAKQAEGVRVHAWLNVLSGWPATTAARDEPSASSPGVPDHLLIRKSDLLLVDDAGQPMPSRNEWDYQWMTPRDPMVEDDLRAVVAELCASYPVAGVHLDRIRYPGGPWRDPGFDGRSAEAITHLVRVARESMPNGLELTCSLVPDYLTADDLGEPEHLAEFGQDGWAWVRDGLVDGIMPMVYTPVRPGADDDWRRLVTDHVNSAGADRVWAPIYAGLAVDEIERQVGGASRLDVVGPAWYSAGLIDAGGHWDRVEKWLQHDM